MLVSIGYLNVKRAQWLWEKQIPVMSCAVCYWSMPKLAGESIDIHDKPSVPLIGLKIYGGGALE